MHEKITSSEPQDEEDIYRQLPFTSNTATVHNDPKNNQNMVMILWYLQAYFVMMVSACKSLNDTIEHLSRTSQFTAPHSSFSAQATNPSTSSTPLLPTPVTNLTYSPMNRAVLYSEATRLMTRTRAEVWDQARNWGLGVLWNNLLGIVAGDCDLG